MDVSEYHKIREMADKYKYSSFTYLDYNDCEMSEIICCNDNLVLIIDSKINPNIIQYATNNYIELIEKLKLINGNIKINFVQKEFKNHLENIGFIELCEFIDYFNDDIQNTKIKFCDYRIIERELNLKYLYKATEKYYGAEGLGLTQSMTPFGRRV